MASFRKIKLTQGKYALVDSEDFQNLNQLKWYYGNGYACRQEFGSQKDGSNGKKIAMHRQLLSAPDSLQVDHANGNKLDNRRRNLRLATHSQNQWNKGIQKNNKSGYKGVHWEKQTQKWRVTINMKDGFRNLGRYSDIKEAVKVHKQAISELHGEFARQK